MKVNSFFKLYACCILVKGSKRASIIDTQRFCLYLIPLDLYNILECGIFDWNKLKQVYDNESLNEYLNFLEENKLGFWTNHPDSFPSINLIWDSPSLITNAIIDIGKNIVYDFSQLVYELDSLGCKAVMIRFFEKKEIRQIGEILKYFECTGIESIDILLADYKDYNIKELDNMIDYNLRIKSLALFDAPKNQLYRKGDDYMGNILFITDKLELNSCGKITSNNFCYTLNMITESINYNNCLNRKISIDIHGNISHCPSFPKIYGNYKIDTLEQILQNDNFKRIWKINKNHIKKCQDCEFRYVCLDCRAYTENNTLYDPPINCKYDPYTCQWV
ncbi:MAG: grasp-with-spasm system SPASM domain peptide maturase [Oscillibacter sp.]|nr:grasp-with-spasm system SPASM domain peptide maturase [Oscillibacter sp.]